MSRTDKDVPWKIRDARHERWPTYRNWFMAPPPWFRTLTWHRPQRNMVRCLSRTLVQEFNATGNVDDWDIPNHQHCHRAWRLWC